VTWDLLEISNIWKLAQHAERSRFNGSEVFASI
jgi:hypothetical protein